MILNKFYSKLILIMYRLYLTLNVSKRFKNKDKLKRIEKGHIEANSKIKHLSY